MSASLQCQSYEVLVRLYSGLAMACVSRLCRVRSLDTIICQTGLPVLIMVLTLPVHVLVFAIGRPAYWDETSIRVKSLGSQPQTPLPYLAVHPRAGVPLTFAVFRP